ncbi:MAG: hypothetical protein GXO07_00275 [Crenarchaeota archaeon]|nr:hypothetical protein [Thermoproteota archaeon]
MDVSYWSLSVALYAVSLYLGTFLRYTGSTFLIPSSADFALALVLLSLLLFKNINVYLIIIGALITSIMLRRSGPKQVLYLKIGAYTVALTSLPLLDYDVYEYARSVLTGFLFVTPDMVALTSISLALTLLLFVNKKVLEFSIFDPEYAELVGLRPWLWLGLLSFSAITTGFAMALSYGFLLAHVVALSASGTTRFKGVILFAAFSAVLSVLIATPLACALSATAVRGLEVLLLRRAGLLEVLRVWKARLPLPRRPVPGL